MDNVGLVTGASSGIGRELARLHAERNRDLVIVARREDELQELRRELEAEHRVRVRVMPADLTKPEARRDLAKQLEADGVFVEYLFNNAGYGYLGEFCEQDWGKLSGMIELNVTAVTHLTHLFAPAMVEYGEGRILNTSSTAGFMPGPLQAVYFATKAYVNSVSKAVASELEGTGVTVTALCPGAVKTEFADTAEMPEENDLMKGAKSPRYTAERGYRAMEHGDLEVITEVGLQVMIKGALPFLPERVGMRQVRKLQEGAMS